MDMRAILMGLTFAVIWSSAFTSARIIVAAAPPLSALTLRYLLSGLLAVLVARWLGQTWRLTPAQWRATIIFGICQNALYLGLNFVAMQTVEASLAAIIASLMPLLVALAGWLFLKEKVDLVTGLSLFVGFAGVAIIMGGRFDGTLDLYGVMLCVLGVIALAVATLSLRGASSGGNYMMVVGLQLLAGAIAVFPAALLLETPDVAWSRDLVLAFVYTTLVPGFLATVIWVHLVNRIGAVRAATFHFLNPFFGVAIAALLLGETLRMLDFVGVAAIALSILTVQVSRAKTR